MLGPMDVVTIGLQEICSSQNKTVQGPRFQKKTRRSSSRCRGLWKGNWRPWISSLFEACHTRILTAQVAIATNNADNLDILKKTKSEGNVVSIRTLELDFRSSCLCCCPRLAIGFVGWEPMLWQPQLRVLSAVCSSRGDAMKHTNHRQAIETCCCYLESEDRFAAVVHKTIEILCELCTTGDRRVILTCVSLLGNQGLIQCRRQRTTWHQQIYLKS